MAIAMKPQCCRMEHVVWDRLYFFTMSTVQKSLRMFRFVLISYGIVGKPGTGIYSSLMTPMLNLVRYVSWRKGLPACLSWFFVLVYTSIVVVYL